MSGLSHQDEDALVKAVLAPEDDCVHNMAPLFREVERIVAEQRAELAEAAAWQVQRIVNHWSAVPPDVLAERQGELLDLRECVTRIRGLARAAAKADREAGGSRG